LKSFSQNYLLEIIKQSILFPSVWYVLLGIILWLTSHLLGLGNTTAYFEPFSLLLDAEHITQYGYRVITLALLAGVLSISIRTGFLFLGIEGVLVLVLISVYLAHVYTHQDSFFLLILFGFVSSFILLRFTYTLHSKEITDDITQGIALNVVATAIAFVILSLTGLQGIQAQGIASEPIFIDQIVVDSAKALLLGICLLILAELGLFTTRYGILLRAWGENKLVTRFNGIERSVITLLYTTIAAALFSLAVVFWIYREGIIQIDSISGLLVDVLATAFIAKLRPLGCVISAVLVVSISSFGLELQLSNYPQELVVGILGFLLVIFSWIQRDPPKQVNI
jgi:general nucleoside transport system permease protein